METTQPLPTATVKNPLAAMQPGETTICEIKRHPIGILGVYVGSMFALIVLAILAFGVAPRVLTEYSSGQVTAIGALVFVVIAAVVVAFTAVARKVYWSNYWIVTSDSITEILQTGLFNTQRSQLSFENLEDVTTEQNGILPHMFGYGKLKAETAGAQLSKFHFLYCPKPDYYARQILNAREKFNESRAYSAKRETVEAGPPPNSPPSYS